MKRNIEEVLFELRVNWGARVYRMDSGDIIIHIGDSNLRDAAVALIEQRCGGVSTLQKNGEKILFLKEDLK